MVKLPVDPVNSVVRMEKAVRTVESNRAAM